MDYTARVVSNVPQSHVTEDHGCNPDWPPNYINLLSYTIGKFPETVLPYKTVNKKVKPSRYRLGQAQAVPGGRGTQISRQSAHEGGKVVSPTYRPPLPSGNIPGTHFC
jgi:hypothetical protein